MIDPHVSTAFRETLLSGRYNLLLGSGVSLDSRNKNGEFLLGAEALRKRLCSVTNVRDNTSLTRVYSLLNAEQRRSELQDRFSGCRPGATVQGLFHFLWRRLFTFNIDDVLEAEYSRDARSKQRIISLNFDSAFEPSTSRNELPIIHLHGSVSKPDSGFVFATTEYARLMSGLNPWMHLLAEILSVEPFIIAGTSLNEIDLEYYLSFRTPATPRTGRGPSLLIEPQSDAATVADCERYGLMLVQAPLGDFLKWLLKSFPTPPTIRDLIVPDTGSLFHGKLTERQELRFFADFELVSAAEEAQAPALSPFLYGREPDWVDLHRHLDIERTDNQISADKVRGLFSSSVDDRLVVLLDDAGTGKTTIVRRVAHDLVREGFVVLSVRAMSRIDVESAKICMAQIGVKFLLLVDNLAEYLEQIVEFLDDKAVASRMVVLSAERAYRREYLEVVLGSRPKHFINLQPLSENELLQVLGRYRSYGLLGVADAVKRPQRYTRDLFGEPFSVVICRLLNDFRPLEQIIRSLWAAAEPAARKAFLCAALARHCYWTGLRYSLIQEILGPTLPLGQYFDSHSPLPLVPNPRDEDFVVPLNSTVGEQVLLYISRLDRDFLLEIFLAVANALSPHVNRQAIMRRSPEARLAGRLFDSDKVVRLLLGELAESFYVAAAENWRWNSRFWEQRALLTSERDLTTALQYARHAVAIEVHPFPLTTLGKILLRRLEGSEEAERVQLFGEAFEKLSKAIDIEASSLRVTVQPFVTLLSGTAKFLEMGGGLSLAQKQRIVTFLNEARFRFRDDLGVSAAVAKLDRLLPK